jgi:hypothetical protein
MTSQIGEITLDSNRAKRARALRRRIARSLPETSRTSSGPSIRRSSPPPLPAKPTSCLTNCRHVLHGFRMDHIQNQSQVSASSAMALPLWSAARRNCAATASRWPITALASLALIWWPSVHTAPCSCQSRGAACADAQTIALKCLAKAGEPRSEPAVAAPAPTLRAAGAGAVCWQP